MTDEYHGVAPAKSTCSIPECGNPGYRRGYCQSHYRRLLKHGNPLGGGSPKAPKGELMRWIHEVALLHTGDECLTWPFGKNGNGYGEVQADGKNSAASRYICGLVNGPPPTPDHEAAHSCGRGSEACTSPIHLSWKTPTENQADRLIHGTHTRGERCGTAKLTENDVRLILAMKGAEPKTHLAKRFGVSPTTVADIHRGRTWFWLPKEAKGMSA